MVFLIITNKFLNKCLGFCMCAWSSIIHLYTQTMTLVENCCVWQATVFRLSLVDKYLDGAIKVSTDQNVTARFLTLFGHRIRYGGGVLKKSIPEIDLLAYEILKVLFRYVLTSKTFQNW